MEKEFVPYELALRMKALGFDESCFACFNGKHHDWLIDDNNGLDNPTINPNKDIGRCVKRPTYSQAFRWFREKHEIEATTSCFYSKRLDIPYEERQYHCHIIRDGVTSKGPKYKTYEEAELACIKELIKIVKNKQ
jgi:hypothetical protein